jgi:hypothetical protein
MKCARRPCANVGNAAAALQEGEGCPMRMVSFVLMLVGVFASGLATLRAGQAAEQTPASGPVASAVGIYCAGCHNGVMRSPSGVLLDQFDATRIAESPDVWTRAYRQLQAGTMPPVGARRPDRATSDAIVRSIETALRANVPPQPDATSQEIAARLAAVLWDSAPDESLLEDARRNLLIRSAVLKGQIKRMLADERARAFVKRFFFLWLGLDRLEKADPDKTHFPDYDASLRDAMTTETELFILNQLREDRDPVELWSANVSFLNEQLARHYGVPNVAGAQFRAVVMPAERAGLLGQGSVHMATSRYQPGSAATYTSPAARAMWVRVRFLGSPPPQPFPGAQPVKPELPITPQTRTLPAEPCVNCHRNFFPLGYALENFDPIGRWRTTDQAGPVDSSGAFVDGTPIDGVVELRNVLLQRPEAFRTTITERLVVFASRKSGTAFRMTPETLIRARQTLYAAAAARWSDIIAAIVRSKPPAGE